MPFDDAIFVFTTLFTLFLASYLILPCKHFECTEWLFFKVNKACSKSHPYKKRFGEFVMQFWCVWRSLCMKFSLEKSMYFHPVYTQWANFHVVRSRFHSLATSDMTDSIRIRIGVESIWRVAHTKQHMCVFIGSCAWIFVSG